MTAATEAAVAATGLSHRYKRQTGIDHVDVTFAKGRFHAVVGPDGVGKSTLLGLISTAKKLQEGQLMVLGEDVRDAGARRRLSRRIAYMPQGLGRNLYPDLTIDEHLDYFAALFGVSASYRRARGAMLLRRTGLAGFESRRARNLSGGMKQKLALCCSLIHEPELLVLDEPTTGVDPLSRREFWELLKVSRRDQPGLTVVCSTGYVDEASNFDEMAFFDEGRLLLQGSPADVLKTTGATSLTEAYSSILSVAGVPIPASHKLPPEPLRHGETIIDAKGLTKRFGPFMAVDGIDLTVRRGEIFAFLGPNGCGKSTTMRMLTGLSTPTSGEISVFGERPRAGSLKLRSRIGYMSQSFSLYGELTARRNVDLNLTLQHVPLPERRPRADEVLERFGLAGLADRKASDLPLGQRQRLALACAVAHKPQLLILDEPTSGVDPLARDAFWAELHRLAREDNVTIFISTHYLSEAERCDRVAFMDAGKILATGTPADLKARSSSETLEDAFITLLEISRGATTAEPDPPHSAAAALRHTGAGFASLRRLLATSHREFRELMRDHVRLGFSLLAAAFLLIVLGHGISMDVERIDFAVLDQDQTPASRGFVQELSGSRYFVREPDPANDAAAERLLVSGKAALLVEIPAGYGRSLLAGKSPELGLWLDAGSPGRAETARSYALALFEGYLRSLSEREARAQPSVALPAMEVRYRYNPTVTSAIAFAPGCIGILLMLTPAMLMAVAVTREKELGSILNLYTTPLRVHEFLIGKQLPYIAIGIVNFGLLYGMTRLHFGVPFNGSFPTLLLGAGLQIVAATGFGMLIAGFARSQVAALTAAQILSIIPSVGYSGLVVPIASMEGAAWYVAHGFPASYFHNIVIGTFLKGLQFPDLTGKLIALLLFGLLFSGIGLALTAKQER
jgi:ribosome-dependent ATPase